MNFIFLAASKKIHTYSYPSDFQDFSGSQSPTLLDEWVFLNVKQFFSEIKKNDCNNVCDEKNVFFLHLLGMDTVGHIYKPNSK